MIFYDNKIQILIPLNVYIEKTEENCLNIYLTFTPASTMFFAEQHERFLIRTWWRGANYSTQQK